MLVSLSQQFSKSYSHNEQLSSGSERFQLFSAAHVDAQHQGAFTCSHLWEFVISGDISSTDGWQWGILEQSSNICKAAPINTVTNTTTASYSCILQSSGSWLHRDTCTCSELLWSTKLPLSCLRHKPTWLFFHYVKLKFYHWKHLVNSHWPTSELRLLSGQADVILF